MGETNVQKKHFFISCDNDYDNDQSDKIPTVDVTFFNESSYYVLVHRDSFYGPIIAEVDTISRETTVPLRPSDNTMHGTVFSMEYKVYPIHDDFDNEHGEIFVSCTDSNVQLPYIIKENEPRSIQIPQPNLVCKSAFIRIKNNYDLPISLRRVGNALGQAGNNAFIIAPYKQGIYKLNGIPDEGERCQYYNIMVSPNNVKYFSEFVSQNGEYIAKSALIYDFSFDGTTIKRTDDGKQKIIFNKE